MEVKIIGNANASTGFLIDHYADGTIRAAVHYATGYWETVLVEGEYELVEPEPALEADEWEVVSDD